MKGDFSLPMTPNDPEPVYVPPGGFSAIMADPAWDHKTWSTKGRGRSPKYRTMTEDEIRSMPVRQAAARDCFLFLWTTSPHLEESFRVMQAWGFKYSSTAFVWVKLNPKAGRLFFDMRSFSMGMGKTTRKNVEFCLLGRKGHPRRLRKDIAELIISNRRRHSEKPEEAYERMQAFCNGPYLDLFSRKDRPGFTAWGDQIGIFNGGKR